MEFQGRCQIPLHSVSSDTSRRPAETLNFTRAAEQVFVAQSSLSSQIGKFEDTVELLLFARLQNGLKLTSAGRIVATFAENTLKEWDQTLAIGPRCSTQRGATSAPRLLLFHQREAP